MPHEQATHTCNNLLGHGPHDLLKAAASTLPPSLEHRDVLGYPERICGRGPPPLGSTHCCRPEPASPTTRTNREGERERQREQPVSGRCGIMNSSKEALATQIRQMKSGRTVDEPQAYRPVGGHTVPVLAKGHEHAPFRTSYRSRAVRRTTANGTTKSVCFAAVRYPSAPAALTAPPLLHPHSHDHTAARAATAWPAAMLPFIHSLRLPLLALSLRLRVELSWKHHNSCRTANTPNFQTRGLLSCNS